MQDFSKAAVRTIRYLHRQECTQTDDATPFTSSYDVIVTLIMQ